MILETTTQNILNSQDYHTMAAKVRNQKRDIEALIQRLEKPRAGGLDNHFEEGIKYALKAVLGVDNSKEFNNACRWRNQILKSACNESHQSSVCVHCQNNPSNCGFQVSEELRCDGFKVKEGAGGCPC